jgi:hypothetical protein
MSAAAAPVARKVRMDVGVMRAGPFPEGIDTREPRRYKKDS